MAEKFYERRDGKPISEENEQAVLWNQEAERQSVEEFFNIIS